MAIVIEVNSNPNAGSNQSSLSSSSYGNVAATTPITIGNGSDDQFASLIEEILLETLQNSGNVSNAANNNTGSVPTQPQSSFTHFAQPGWGNTSFHQNSGKQALPLELLAVAMLLQKQQQNGGSSDEQNNVLALIVAALLAKQQGSGTTGLQAPTSTPMTAPMTTPTTISTPVQAATNSTASDPIQIDFGDNSTTVSNPSSKFQQFHAPTSLWGQKTQTPQTPVNGATSAQPAQQQGSTATPQPSLDIEIKGNVPKSGIEIDVGSSATVNTAAAN